MKDWADNGCILGVRVRTAGKIQRIYYMSVTYLFLVREETVRQYIVTKVNVF